MNDVMSGRNPGLLLKQRLQRGEACIGAWCGLDSLATIEAMSHLDFDWVLIDCEHGLTAAEHCLPQIQAADRAGKAVFVRVPRLDAALIGRVLDAEKDDRMEGTAAAVALSVANGASIVRVHDVREMSRVVRMTDAICKARQA